MTKTIDLGAIKERCDKATPGPWVENCPVTGPHAAELSPFLDRLWWINTEPQTEHGAGEIICVVGCRVGRGADCDFIAHAREDIPALLEEIANLRARVEVERAACRVALSRETDQYRRASQLRLVSQDIWDHCTVRADDLRGADAIKEWLELLNRREEE